MKTTMGMLAVLTLAGCMTEGDGADDELAIERTSGEMQGRHLLGDLADNLGADPLLHFHVMPGASGPGGAATVGVVSAQLTASDSRGSYSGADPRFIGVRFLGVGGGEVEITAVSKSSVPGVSYYTLKYRASSSLAWRPYCAGGAATVPMHGEWSRTGLHTASARISFGCADGVTHKCTNWSFVAGTDPLLSIWREHQACTRMARADYCSNGTSHTREGTLINIYDGDGTTAWPSPVVVNPASWPPPPADFYFEAAWRAGSDLPVCLSRLRWQSLPRELCGPALPDPRFVPNGVFCDDMTLTDMAAADALVYDASVFNDLALHRWRTAAGDDEVSTVRGFVNPVPPIAMPPFTGVDVHVERDGVLLRSLPASVLPTEVDEVRAYEIGTGDHVVTTAATAPPGATDLGVDGFVFRAPRSSANGNPDDDTTPLYLYSDGTDYLTTTSGAPGAGFMLIDTIGHVWF